MEWDIFVGDLVAGGLELTEAVVSGAVNFVAEEIHDMSHKVCVVVRRNVNQSELRVDLELDRQFSLRLKVFVIDEWIRRTNSPILPVQRLECLEL